MVGAAVGDFFLPRRIWRSDLIAWSLSGAPSCTPFKAAVRRWVASRMRSFAITSGMGMAWCLYRNVLVICSPPMSRMMILMHQ